MFQRIVFGIIIVAAASSSVIANEVVYKWEIWGFRHGQNGQVNFGVFETPEAAFRVKAEILKTDYGLAADKPYGLQVYRVTFVKGVRIRPRATDVAEESESTLSDQVMPAIPKPSLTIKQPERVWVDPGAYNSPMASSQQKSTLVGRW